MQLITIVEDYCWRLAHSAMVAPLDEGGVVATVPGVPGVIASGDTLKECFLDLFRRLEDWVSTLLQNGWTLPVVDGIDLNSEEGRALARYHEARINPSGGPPAASNEEFLAYLDALVEQAPS